MGYGNYNNNYGGGGYNRGNYNGGGYRSQPNREQKKHSGCKSGVDKNGKQYVSGWKYDKRNGLRKFYASPYSGTHETKSKSNRIWQNWFVRIEMPNGQEIKTSGLYDVSTGKITISQLGFVMNPRGGRGGYVGPYFYRKNGR